MKNIKYSQKQKAYKLLSNENRYKILELLNIKGEFSVSELAKATKISQSAVSHQLAKLEDQAIVKATKRSKRVFYQLNNNKLTHYVLALIGTNNSNNNVSPTEHQSVMMLFILALWTAVIFFLILAFFL